MSTSDRLLHTLRRIVSLLGDDEMAPWREWANGWLSGKDRTEESAWCAVAVAWEVATAAAKAAQAAAMARDAAALSHDDRLEKTRKACAARVRAAHRREAIAQAATMASRAAEAAAQEAKAAARLRENVTRAWDQIQNIQAKVIARDHS